MLSSIFAAFVKASSISVMMRGVMEYIFRPQRLDEIFESHAKLQYSRELLFSSLVNLLSLVVCRAHLEVGGVHLYSPGISVSCDPKAACKNNLSNFPANAVAEQPLQASP